MTMKLEEITDTKQNSIESFFEGRVSWEKHLDLNKAVCVWGAQDIRPLFSLCLARSSIQFVKFS